MYILKKVVFYKYLQYYVKMWNKDKKEQNKKKNT